MLETRTYPGVEHNMNHRLVEAFENLDAHISRKRERYPMKKATGMTLVREVLRMRQRQVDNLQGFINREDVLELDANSDGKNRLMPRYFFNEDTLKAFLALGFAVREYSPIDKFWEVNWKMVVPQARIDLGNNYVVNLIKDPKSTRKNA